MGEAKAFASIDRKERADHVCDCRVVSDSFSSLSAERSSLSRLPIRLLLTPVGREGGWIFEEQVRDGALPWVWIRQTFTKVQQEETELSFLTVPNIVSY